MLAFSPCYGLTSDPADQLLASERQNNTLAFSDVMMTGEYPTYKLLDYQRQGIVLPEEAGDQELLKKGVCDFCPSPAMGQPLTRPTKMP